MAEMDMTETAAKINAAAMANNQITDQSLNADAPLPTDAIQATMDGRVTEVKVDETVIQDFLPKEEALDTQMAATEARIIQLAYLRDDVISANGMCQKFATEAIEIKPDFGQNKPVAYYSKHPSQTRYQASLEEMDQAIQSDVCSQWRILSTWLNECLQRPFDAIVGVEKEWLNKTTNFFSISCEFSGIQQCMMDQKYQWNEKALQLDAASNLLPNFITIQKLAMKEDFFMAYLQLPTALEKLTSYVGSWVLLTQMYLDQVKNIESIQKLPKMNIPEVPKVILIKNSSLAITALGDELAFHLNSEGKQKELLDTEELLGRLASTASEAPLDEIVNRLITLRQEMTKLAEVEQQWGDYIQSLDKFSGKLPVATLFARQLIAKLMPLNKLAVAVNGYAAIYVMTFVNGLQRAGQYADAVVNKAWVDMQRRPAVFQTEANAREGIKTSIDQLASAVASL